MKKIFFKCYLLVLMFLSPFCANAQVTIGSGEEPHTDALLDLKQNEDGTSTKGMLLPRVSLTSTASEEPLSAHVAGMTVYNTATNNDVTPGIYHNDGTKWVRASLPKGTANGNMLTWTEVKDGDVVVGGSWEQINPDDVPYVRSLDIAIDATVSANSGSWHGTAQCHEHHTNFRILNVVPVFRTIEESGKDAGTFLSEYLDITATGTRVNDNTNIIVWYVKIENSNILDTNKIELDKVRIHYTCEAGGEFESLVWEHVPAVGK